MISPLIFTNLDKLPEDGIPSELLVYEEPKSDNTHFFTDSERTNEINYNSRSFLLNPVRECTEERAVHSLINHHEPIEWPTLLTHILLMNLGHPYLLQWHFQHSLWRR